MSKQDRTMQKPRSDADLFFRLSGYAYENYYFSLGLTGFFFF
jgi:hypothetical protein